MTEDAISSLKTDEVPCLIPAFNNPTYVRQIIGRLSRFPDLRVVILDNASDYPAMLDLYSELEAGAQGVSIIRLGCNAGPRLVWYSEPLFQSLPQYFCITDPDLELNAELPDNFLAMLIGITEEYMIGKAGFALSLADRDVMLQSRFRYWDGWHTIWEAEQRHWMLRLESDAPTSDPRYYASIDTTFALYNKKYFDLGCPFDGIRVAGRFTCRHLPWYQDNGLPKAEESYYRKMTEFSYYQGERPARQMRSQFAYEDKYASVAAEAIASR